MERLTHEADLRDPSVSEDGRFAIAVRTRNGKSQSVSVDLSSRLISEVTLPSLVAPVDDPAVSRDGSIAFVRNQGKGWRLFVSKDLNGRAGYNVLLWLRAVQRAGIEYVAPSPPKVKEVDEDAHQSTLLR